MAHWAKVRDGIVTQVIVAEEDFWALSFEEVGCAADIDLFADAFAEVILLRPKTMATKSSQKVWGTLTPHPIIRIISKNNMVFNPSLIRVDQ